MSYRTFLVSSAMLPEPIVAKVPHELTAIAFRQLQHHFPREAGYTVSLQPGLSDSPRLALWRLLGWCVLIGVVFALVLAWVLS